MEISLESLYLDIGALSNQIDSMVTFCTLYTPRTGT